MEKEEGKNRAFGGAFEEREPDILSFESECARFCIEYAEAHGYARDAPFCCESNKMGNSGSNWDPLQLVTDKARAKFAGKVGAPGPATNPDDVGDVYRYRSGAPDTRGRCVIGKAGSTKRTSNEKVGPGHDNRAVKSVILTLDDVYAAFPSYNAYCTNDCLQSGVVGYGSYSYLDDFGWSTMAGAGTPGTHRNTNGAFSPFGGLHPNANTGPTENALDGSRGNGVCEDGGPGDETNFKEQYGWPRCQYGSDCADCGPRPGPPSPPRSLASSDSPPPPLPLATAPPPASMPSASSPPAFASPPRADAKARCDAASLACAKAESDTLVSGLSRCSKTPTCTLRMADALTSAAAMAPSTASFPRRV